MKRKVILFLLSVILFSGFIYFLGSFIPTDKLKGLVASFGVFGPIILILLITITQIIAPLSGSPVYFAGFALFGKWVFIYGYIASLISSVINFYIARVWGRDLVVRFVGQKNMKLVDDFTQDYGAKTLIFLRVIQGYMHDFVSFAYGLTNIKFKTYIIITTVCPIPWLIVWLYLTTKVVSDFYDFAKWYLIMLVPMFIASSWFIQRLKAKKVNKKVKIT